MRMWQATEIGQREIHELRDLFFGFSNVGVCGWSWSGNQGSGDTNGRFEIWTPSNGGVSRPRHKNQAWRTLCGFIELQGHPWSSVRFVTSRLVCFRSWILKGFFFVARSGGCCRKPKLWWCGGRGGYGCGRINDGGRQNDFSPSNRRRSSKAMDVLFNSCVSSSSFSSASQLLLISIFVLKLEDQLRTPNQKSMSSIRSHGSGFRNGTLDLTIRDLRSGSSLLRRQGSLIRSREEPSPTRHCSPASRVFLTGWGWWLCLRLCMIKSVRLDVFLFWERNRNKEENQPLTQTCQKEKECSHFFWHICVEMTTWIMEC